MLKGKLNIYTCDVCHGHIVTKDEDEGVTPFMMKCRADKGCGGSMVSSMYRVFDQSMRPSYVWRRATDTERAEMDRGSLGHANQGGLFLHEVAE